MEKHETYRLPIPDEHVLWADDFRSIFEGLPKNIYDICYYGFTEMVNNVKDHSGSEKLYISVERTKKEVKIFISDEGEGIFKRITRLCHLPDERLALLELAKGKLTTDPEHHTGEGIFFTSRIFDKFYIISEGLTFSHDDTSSEDYLEQFDLQHASKGTVLYMSISLDQKRTTKEVFDKFASSNDDFNFNKTIVPVKLAQYEGESLISRSQGKRLVAGFEKFKQIKLDFKGVSTIGPAFADEIFRVFQNKYPLIKLSYVNANQEVEKMIRRALHAAKEQ